MAQKIIIPEFGLTKPKVSFFLLLSLTAAFAEGLGMTMLLPVIEYLKDPGAMDIMAEASRFWGSVYGFFNFFGLKVSFLGLLMVAFGLIVLRVGIMYLVRLYKFWLAQTLLHKMRMTLFNSFIESDYSRFDQRNTGHMVNTVTTEAKNVSIYYTNLLTIISDAIIFAGLSVILFALSPGMAAATIVLMLTAGLLVSVFVRKTKNLSYMATEANMGFVHKLVERLFALKLIKLNAAAESEAGKIMQASELTRDRLFRLQVLSERVSLILEPCVVGSTVIILYVAVTWIKMGLGEIGLFMLMLIRLLPIVKEVMSARQRIQANLGSLSVVRETIEKSRQMKEKVNSDGAVFTGIKQDIRLENVWFTYTGSEQPALREINLVLPANTMTALVGPSGSGKSTLVDLLPLLRKPQKGRLLFDGRPAEDYKLNDLRRCMAFVSQESVIFNDTVRANISFGHDEVSENDIKQALGKARCTEFISSLPQKLDTILGEQGLRLSGGQRQRISLARALVKKAPILILDEPTSALDSEVEQDIQEVITELRRNSGTTIIIIAHRLSTIRQSDQIVVLHEGRIEQQGTHDELVTNREWYAKINALQSG
jgi:subfamily B ATP-binding cassette protein MsbA